MNTIAVIDDDIYIGDMLEKVLQKEGYQVIRAYSGTEALLLLKSYKPSLILLDLMLPGLSGEEILPRLSGIPVIVISAKTDITDKVSLLMDGAADYLTKPFDTRELLARITVQLRKAEHEDQQPLLSFESLHLDTTTHEVFLSVQTGIPDIALKLTKTEYAILKLLMLNPGQVIPKSLILDRISVDTPDCVESSLKVHISNIRRKLREAGGMDCIEAVWGIGFRLRKRDEEHTMS